MTAGSRLREMVARAGYSFERFARDAGFKGASSVQRYMEDGRDFLPFDRVERFARALVGKGTPPITREEVYALSGVNPVIRGETNSREARNAPKSEIKVATDQSNIGYMARDLPIRGETRGEDAYYFGDGSTVLAMTLRPTYLAHVPSAYAVYIYGESMAPRYRPGEMVFIDPVRPAAPGEDVVVQFKDGTGLVKELVARSPGGLRLRQHNPPLETEYDAESVRSVHLIIGATRVRA